MQLHRARLLAIASLLVAPASALADPPCGAVEAQFTPGAKDLQIVVWIEDAQGNYLDTVYVTRATGQFGIGNRPGTPLLKTDFKWPYGRREMVAPVWAHRRNHHYPKVVMGGICGNSPTTDCPDNTPCAGDCVDSTIAYHPRVSSWEPYFCSPSGASSIDAMSCASQGTFSKGAFADMPDYSLYPPRADLNPPCSAASDCPGYPTSTPVCANGRCIFDRDSTELPQFAGANDLVAISAATPIAGVPVAPPVTWMPQSLPDGDYVLWLEVSQESDFNSAHTYQCQTDTVSAWDFEGHQFLGQPSVVYSVPFHVDGAAHTIATNDYSGYGAWDGSDGTLHAADGTITTGKDGSGAGRLLSVNGARLTVVVGGCGMSDGGMPPVPDGGSPPDMTPPPCLAPAAAKSLTADPKPTSIAISWVEPDGVAVDHYDVRYRTGSVPIGDADFDTQLRPSMTPPMPDHPGATQTMTLAGLVATTPYTIAVRASSKCGGKSPVASLSVDTPAQTFTTLHGCFVATAAYGAPGDRSVAVLRALRDRRLVHSAAGQLFVATYYAVSPPLASVIARVPPLRALARRALAPLVDLAASLR